MRTLGVIAGAGEFPRLLIQGARRAGVRVVCIGVRGAVDRRLADMCDAFAAFRAGSLEAPLEFARRHGVQDLVLSGQVKPASIFTLWPDATCRRLLAQLERRNAHTIFGLLCSFLEQQGFRVLDSTTYMQEHLPAAGLLAGPEPTPEQRETMENGMRLARHIARLDIGQSLMVQGSRVTAVEAFKGTNECIRSGGNRPAPATLCKVTKPGHDMRFDVPCIGLGTVQNCLAANVNHIAFQARKTFLLQREQVLELCNRHGITLQAVDLSEEPAAPLARVQDDAAHARLMAHELERLGIGHSAVVCDGVVIAVEDPDGPAKCIRRAGEYMRRLRLARLFGWLLGVLTGSGGSRPAPVVMAGTPAFSPTPAERRAAKRAGIQIR